MAITTVTAASAEPVSLLEAKAHLRLVGTDEDAYLAAIIPAAREAIENITGRAIVSTRFKLVLDSFPACDTIELPRNPVSAVHSVKYYNASSVLTTFSSGSYIADTSSEPARIVLKNGYSWPDTWSDINAVEIEFTAGYGDAGSDAPPSFRHAILLFLDHLYANRSVVQGTQVYEVPHTISLLVLPYKIW